MKFCELTLATPEENLACDEALLDLCDDGLEDEVLRFWESPRYFVVVGYANHTAAEVHLPFCNQNTIPVLRRCTGGGTVHPSSHTSYSLDVFGSYVVCVHAFLGLAWEGGQQGDN